MIFAIIPTMTVSAVFSKSVSCMSMGRNSTLQPISVSTEGGFLNLREFQFVDCKFSKWETPSMGGHFTHHLVLIPALTWQKWPQLAHAESSDPSTLSLDFLSIFSICYSIFLSYFSCLLSIALFFFEGLRNFGSFYSSWLLSWSWLIDKRGDSAFVLFSSCLHFFEQHGNIRSFLNTGSGDLMKRDAMW